MQNVWFNFVPSSEKKGKSQNQFQFLIWFKFVNMRNITIYNVHFKFLFKICLRRGWRIPFWIWIKFLPTLHPCYLRSVSSIFDRAILSSDHPISTLWFVILCWFRITLCRKLQKSELMSHVHALSSTCMHLVARACT